MKPAAFEYVAPGSVEDVLAELATTEVDAKVIAGGQSLVPMMNFRLARPGKLVDINRASGLSFLSREDGKLSIGAATRQATVERSALVARHWPLLAQALPHVAHPQIRNRGTVGGSIAHADPGAEIPTVLLAYGGHVEVASVRGVRQVSAHDLFLGQFVTALEPDELITRIVLPAVPARTSVSFHEVARRAGDFAFAGAAAVLTLDEDGRCQEVALALLGVAPTPVRAATAEAALAGEVPTPQRITDAAAAAAVGLNPPSDVHAGSGYRVAALQEMAARALTDACASAGRRAA